MMRLVKTLLSAGVAGLILAQPAVGGEEGFVALFNGKDLSGWVNVNCAPDTFTSRIPIGIRAGPMFNLPAGWALAHRSIGLPFAWHCERFNGCFVSWT